MYGLIQTQMCSPFWCNLESMPCGSGKASSSQRKLHQWCAFIQKQSKWKTCSGILRWAIPSMKLCTVFSSYCVVNDVVSHNPKDHAGGSGGRPVSAP